LAWPAALAWPDPLPDAAATLGYVANWHFVAGSANYFAPSFPSPLLHTWSLAIEEQFYLVWPLVVFAVLGGLTQLGRKARAVPDVRRRLAWLGVLCGVGAVGSAAWMWVLTPADASLNRAYYGTDTRAQALLVGAALAVALALWPARTDGVRRFGAVMGAAGLLGMGVVWYLIPEASSFHGGFLLASVASGALVAGVVLAPGGLAARALSVRPLRYVGTISYGAYLWYWPVALVMTPERTGLGEWALFGSRTAVTLGIAALSARLVEMPIRRGALPARRALVAIPSAVAVSLALVAVSTVPASPVAGPPAGHRVPALTTSRVHRTGPPVKVLLVGDSMAGSLGASLAPEASDYGVRIINEGHPGCAVSTDSVFRFLLYTNPPGSPCALGKPAALLDQWQQWVDRYRPDVVVYLGRVDLMNQDYDGSWTSIGDPAFDTFLQSQLGRGVAILGSRGARVVLMTSPYYDSTVQGGGVAVPEDAPGRVTVDDRILAAVTSAHPGVTLFPLGKVVTPTGRYQQDVDGVDMRCDDGVHFSADAGLVLAPRLLPLLVQLGHSARVDPVPDAAPDPAPVPAPVPDWYEKLQCGQA
jgi:peptidoglycan/LPS O-acetylase OafA/YrhL